MTTLPARNRTRPRAAHLPACDAPRCDNPAMFRVVVLGVTQHLCKDCAEMMRAYCARDRIEPEVKRL